MPALLAFEQAAQNVGENSLKRAFHLNVNKSELQRINFRLQRLLLEWAANDGVVVVVRHPMSAYGNPT